MTAASITKAPTECRTIANRYRLSKRVGSGGMGTVFEAIDQITKHRVAVKLVRPECAYNAEVVARFFREARLASRISHPNVAAILQAGRCQAEDCFYVVQEFLDGPTLRDELTRYGSLSIARARELLVPLMKGTVSAHLVGVVHRDIKPENIILADTASGSRATLIDFGLAKSIDERAERVTVTGVAVGTPLYMSPEQARGLKDIDAQADVWAMGVIWFEALTGRPPFRGKSSLAVLTELLLGQIPRVEACNPDVPRALADVIHRALERDRSVRYRTMIEFVGALEACLDTLAIEDASRVRDEPPRYSDIWPVAPTERFTGVEVELKGVEPSTS